MIRVGLVDDHILVRAGLKQYLGEQVDLRVTGEASNGKEALELARGGEVDVLLMDLSMPDQSGVDALAAIKARFPHIREPKQQDICYATQNRQDAVKFMAPQVDVVIVVGSPTSSNSNRLRELAERLGTPAYMVDCPEDLQEIWLDQRPRVGLTAGASAPDVLVQQVISRLKALGATSVRRMQGVEESVRFPLPKGLGGTGLDRPLPADRTGG